MPLAMTPRLAFAAFAAFAACACAPRLYVQPGPDEPHALAKVRVVNHSAPGPGLHELMTLNRLQIPLPPGPSDDTSPRATSVRVRLEPSLWRMSTSFFHTYTTTSTQSYTYACGRSTCTGSRTVSQTHTAVDGACSAGLIFQPEPQRIYLLQYDFYVDQRCSLQCLEQLPQPDGSFRLVPCASRPVVVD